MTPREMIDWTLRDSGWGDARRARARTLDRLPAADSTRAHYTQGFRLAGQQIPLQAGLAERAVQVALARRTRSRDAGAAGPLGDDRGGGCRASVPAGDVAGAQFLNSSFNKTPTSLEREVRPTRDDPSGRCRVRLASPTATGRWSAIARGEVRLHAKLFDGVRRGVLIAESIWPNAAYEDGAGSTH